MQIKFESANKLVVTFCNHLKKESDQDLATKALLENDWDEFFYIVCEKQHTQKQWKKAVVLSSLADYVFDLWRKQFTE